MKDWRNNLRSRAFEIEDIVCRDYCDETTDAADLALDELHRNSNRTNEELAQLVAQRILQP